MTTKTIYIAHDGKKFSNEYDCKNYESSLNQDKESYDKCLKEISRLKQWRIPYYVKKVNVVKCALESIDSRQKNRDTKIKKSLYEFSRAGLVLDLSKAEHDLETVVKELKSTRRTLTFYGIKLKYKRAIANSKRLDGGV